MALILRNGGSQNPDRWLKEPRNNQPFSYTLKKGRNGEYTKELFIDRREKSKSLVWSSIKIAFNKALEKSGTVFTQPKELADVRGVSYTFSLLWRFGIITVPENLGRKLKGNRK